jgi:purine-binding chemotaxis protein CheW
MPRFVTGVISLRGVIIPVLDMRLRLSLGAGEATGSERVVVLKTGSGYCGVLVDEVIQVVKLRMDEIEEPPAILEGIDREFVMGLGRFDNRMLILLNLENILNLELN